MHVDVDPCQSMSNRSHTSFGTQGNLDPPRELNVCSRLHSTQTGQREAFHRGGRQECGWFGEWEELQVTQGWRHVNCVIVQCCKFLKLLLLVPCFSSPLFDKTSGCFGAQVSLKTWTSRNVATPWWDPPAWSGAFPGASGSAPMWRCPCWGHLTIFFSRFLLEQPENWIVDVCWCLGMPSSSLRMNSHRLTLSISLTWL